MQYALKYIRRIKENFIELMSDLSIEQLNEIPEGYNNNIIWNFGHIVNTTPGLCYLRTGVDPNFQVPLLAKYNRGTKPDEFVTKEELEELKGLAFSYLDKIEKDYEAGVFQKITPFATLTFKYEMDTIDELLTCIAAHESFHLGIANAMKKLVKQKTLTTNN
jgi:hypothetical protein